MAMVLYERERFVKGKIRLSIRIDFNIVLVKVFGCSICT